MAGRLTELEQAKVGVDSYYAAGTSRTKASNTLFVSYRDAVPPVPKEQRAGHAENLFRQIPGYVGVRQVKGLAFVDFDSIKASTAAMMRYQGKLGLTIDYDKDAGVAGKRQRETAESTRKSQHAASSSDYFCAQCGTKALRTSGVLMSELPARGTDGARVVDESKELEHLLLCPLTEEQPALVRRDKGVEKQFRLGCRSCGERIVRVYVPCPCSESDA